MTIKFNKLTCIIIITLLTATVYAVLINNEFVNWDDDGMIVNNTGILR